MDDARAPGNSLTCRPDDVRAVFANLSTNYDRLNTWMSWGMLAGWQRALVQSLGLGPEERALDICTGTGEVAIALGRRGVQVTGLDFCAAMLERANRKALAQGVEIEWVEADALQLPFADASYDGATLSLALRNIQDRTACFAELARVVKPNGRLAILELSRPPHPLMRAGFAVYTERLIPALGRCLSASSPWQYFASSLQNLPSPGCVTDELVSAGWGVVHHHYRVFGSVSLYIVEQER